MRDVGFAGSQPRNESLGLRGYYAARTSGVSTGLCNSGWVSVATGKARDLGRTKYILSGGFDGHMLKREGSGEAQREHRGPEV